jgi:Fe-S-cluster containining protein
MAAPVRLELDRGLLHGFRYRCRPGCGLCCFAEPRTLPDERARLVQIAPEAEWAEGPDGPVLAARPDGGACQFLRSVRCTVHEARPHPCVEFPVSVHVGTRAQATLVLACPGVELAPLAGFAGSPTGEAPVGFEEELGSAERRLPLVSPRALGEARRRHRTLRRRLERDDRWVPEPEVRATLGARLPLPTDADFPAPDPPPAEEGLEFLPLFFDGRAGPVALAGTDGNWELLELAPEGGVRAHLGQIPPPDRLPPLTDDAARLLEGYLRYHLARDAFLAAELVEMVEAEEGSVDEWVGTGLRALGATVVSRGLVRAKLRRDVDGPLTADDIADGIRATDFEALDRPTWGLRL